MGVGSQRGGGAPEGRTYENPRASRGCDETARTNTEGGGVRTLGGTEARVYLAPGKGWGRLPGERMGEAVLGGGASRRRDVRKPLSVPR